jgi:hypothetical protein
MAIFDNDLNTSCFNLLPVLLHIIIHQNKFPFDLKNMTSLRPNIIRFSSRESASCNFPHTLGPVTIFPLPTKDGEFYQAIIIVNVYTLSL